MNRYRSAAGVAFIALLAGCALGPPAVKPELKLPAAFEAPTLTTPPPVAVDMDRWWTAYNDDQLTSLIEQALAQAPDAKSARARLDEATAIRHGALAAYDPQGGLNVAAGRTSTSALSGNQSASIPGVGTFSLTGAGVSNSEGASFDVSWEVDIFGRRPVARHAADADLAAATFNAAAVRTSLAAQVADELFQARGLAIQLEDARETQRIDTQLAQAAARKTAFGIASQSDEHIAQSLADQSGARVASLESQLTVARRLLMVLEGTGVDPLASLPVAAQVGAPPPIPASLPGDLLTRRPDVREAAAELTSANGKLKLSELALLPTIRLQPSAMLSAGPTLFGGPATLASSTFAAGLAQPLLDLPHLKSEIHAQDARARRAAIVYDSTLQSAYAEATNALVQLAADEEGVKRLTAAEADARWAFDAARRRYAAGTDDITAALVAEQAWRDARSQLTAAQVETLRRSVQAFKALGGGWAPAPIDLARR